jgi:hypothetical protein
VDEVTNLLLHSHPVRHVIEIRLTETQAFVGSFVEVERSGSELSLPTGVLLVNSAGLRVIEATQR